jgi:hypothetical protein
MATASLPTAPAGRELEDFFAALLQSTGHYVEKNIEERSILELDIVATRYDGGRPSLRLFEVKGTAARLEDLFKLVGRMRYLGITEGAFITTEPPRDREPTWFRRVGEKCDVKCVQVEDLNDAARIFESHGYGLAGDLEHAIWRYSFWIERSFLRTVRAMRPSVEAARIAVDYYMLVNSETFLTPDPLDRVSALYSAYQDHPKLTADVAEEMAGGLEEGQALMQQALHTGRQPAIHAVLYFEHRGRLAILKSAVDYLLAGGGIRVLSPKEIELDFRLAGLPRTFLRGLEWLEQQVDYWLFPVFWQNYLWGWGGLLPDEHYDATLADIARASGLSAEHAAPALEAYDKLFPIEGGWHHHYSNADYQFVKMTPAPFQGLGAFHQLTRAGTSDYRAFLPSGQYTASDFARAHNSAVNLLAAESEVAGD